MWYIILALIAAIYLLLNVFPIAGGEIQSYLVRPSLWLSLGIISFLIARNEGLNILKFKKVRRWGLGKTPIHAGLLLGGFQAALLIIIGIFFGFGKSPYSFTPKFLAINIFFVISLLIGTEISRAYLIKKAQKSSRKYITLSIVATTFLYTFLLLKPTDLSQLSLQNPEFLLEFLGSTLIVGIAVNLLASYLSYLGGATASLAYMGIIIGFEWFSPILPDPHWTVMALIGTIAPAIGFLVLQDTIEPFIEKKRKFRTRRSSSRSGWTLTAIFAVIIIFFSYGYLGVEPTVIYSNSMFPEYDVGDIVIIDDVDPADIEIGDVIQYIREDKAIILHRVIEIEQDENGVYFITKGDANNDADTSPVLHQNVLGKAVFKIPELGWIQIYFKSLFKPVTEQID